MIILLNGTSSSGKTSILHALQDILAEPYLEAGIDKFIFMLPERYLERPLWDDVLGLADRPGQTGLALVSGMHRAIQALAQSGLNLLVDHVLVDSNWVKDCAARLEGLPAYLVGVHCPLAILEERERSRKNRTLGQAARQFPIIHTNLVYDLEVDTARFSPLECAQQIKSHIQAHPPRALNQNKGLG